MSIYGPLGGKCSETMSCGNKDFDDTIENKLVSQGGVSGVLVHVKLLPETRADITSYE